MWAVKKEIGKMVHKDGCKMSFGRKDATCPRCQQLMAGAEPRKAWGAEKREAEERLSNSIRNHDCARSGCGVVCTAFEW